MLLCHTGLALSSPVAGFGVSLSSVSFLLRSSLVVFIFSLFVLSGLLAGSLCVLLRIRACTCAVSFMLNFVSCLLDSNFIFSFCGCPFFSSSSGMVTSSSRVITNGATSTRYAVYQKAETASAVKIKKRARIVCPTPQCKTAGFSEEEACIVCLFSVKQTEEEDNERHTKEKGNR